MTQPEVRGNYQKYTNHNFLHQLLLRNFLHHLALLVTGSLERHGLGTMRAAGLRPAPPLRVLDVGCGEGFVISFLRRRWPQFQLCGVDNSRSALSGAIESSRSLLQGDAHRLPFVSRSWDLVLGLEILEHLPHPQAALEEIKRVAQGDIILSVPNQPYFALGNLLRGKNLGHWGDDPEHLHHWRSGQFLSLIQRQVKVVRVVRPFPWVMVLAERREPEAGAHEP